MRITAEADLAQLARATRLRRGLDQRDVAEAAGVSLSALRRLEAGQGTTTRTVLAVFATLGVEIQAVGDMPPAGRRRAPSLPTTPTGLERREERSSWFLHRAVAAKLRNSARRDVIDLARANLRVLRGNASSTARGGAIEPGFRAR